jgi:hypothetical protein
MIYIMMYDIVFLNINNFLLFTTQDRYSIKSINKLFLFANKHNYR